MPHTDKKYLDREPVPYPQYICKSKAHGKGLGSHRCRSHVDHDEEHQCVCGKKWAKATA